MKLSKKDVLDRETWVSQLFREQGGLSVRKAQALIVARFGKQMRPARILEIRRQVRTGNHSESDTLTQRQNP